MNENELAFHYVCTHERARELVDRHDRFWVSNCGCREGRGKCARSRVDVCLIFAGSFPGSGTSKRQVTRADVEEILCEATDKRLVTRPFRDETRTTTEGICFCCDDCCGYFLDPSERCDKGEFVEHTEPLKCNNCGECVGVCHFKVRTMNEGELLADSDSCYGCGLCVDVCPEKCIELIRRA